MDDLKAFERILSKLDKIDTTIEKLDIRIDSIDMSLALQGQILEEHQRRSLANEESISILEDKSRQAIDILKKDHREAIDILKNDNREAIELLKKETEPLKAHIHAWSGAAKLITVLGSVLGALAGILKILGKI